MKLIKMEKTNQESSISSSLPKKIQDLSKALKKEI